MYISIKQCTSSISFNPPTNLWAAPLWAPYSDGKTKAQRVQATHLSLSTLKRPARLQSPCSSSPPCTHSSWRTKVHTDEDLTPSATKPEISWWGNPTDFSGGKGFFLKFPRVEGLIPPRNVAPADSSSQVQAPLLPRLRWLHRPPGTPVLTTVAHTSLMSLLKSTGHVTSSYKWKTGHFPSSLTPSGRNHARRTNVGVIYLLSLIQTFNTNNAVSEWSINHHKICTSCVKVNSDTELQVLAQIQNTERYARHLITEMWSMCKYFKMDMPPALPPQMYLGKGAGLWKIKFTLLTIQSSSAFL